jgi:hypothetical protein
VREGGVEREKFRFLTLREETRWLKSEGISKYEAVDMRARTEATEAAAVMIMVRDGVELADMMSRGSPDWLTSNFLYRLCFSC